MKLSIQAGSTSQTVNVFIQDSTSTTGAGLTGLAYNSAGLTAYYGLPRAASAAITLATQTVTGAFSSGGFVEVDATNMPGIYRFDIPNAAIASGIFSDIYLKGATNMVPCVLEIALTAWNNQDSVRGGMTALPNANAAASGGLIINGSNTGTVNLAALTVTGATTMTGNMSLAAGLTITQSTTNGHGIVVTGNGTGSGIRAVAGATGSGFNIVGGSTSGDGVSIATTNGHGINSTATGSGKHGMTLTGGTSGNGLTCTAGTSGGGLVANQIIVANAITGTLSSTQATTSLTSTTDSLYVGRSIVWQTGALAGSACAITAYVGSTKLLTFTATPSGASPSNGDTFEIV